MRICVKPNNCLTEFYLFTHRKLFFGYKPKPSLKGHNFHKIQGGLGYGSNKTI